MCFLHRKDKIMLWKRGNHILPTPSTYSADIEDIDKESYSSAIDGSLIDNPIAVGLLKLSMSWNLNSEQEAEELIKLTYVNPLILTIKIPVVEGGILENAKFRVSKRKVDMINTEKGESTSNTFWKISFSLMQKELTQAQKQIVEGEN